MSVLITLKIPGDTEKFRRALDEHSAELVEVSERGRAAGAIHHRFGIGDGFVMVVDEWDSADHFHAFFSNPDMQEFVGSMGGDTSVPPEITVAEAVSSADEF